MPIAFTALARKKHLIWPSRFTSSTNSSAIQGLTAVTSRRISRRPSPKSVSAISGPYQQQLAPGTGERALGKRYVDDSKVSDHHAIIPTAVAMQPEKLSEEESKIYDLVCRRLLMLWHDDYLQEVTTVITAIRSERIIDRYRTTGTVVRQTGWKILDAGADARRREPKRDAEATDQALPATLAQVSHKM